MVTRYQHGFTKVTEMDDELVIEHTGNMGNTLDSVNENLQALGFMVIDNLKRWLDVTCEQGSPDYHYLLRLKKRKDDGIQSDIAC